MPRHLQRTMAAVLLPLFLFYATGCSSIRKVPAVEAAPPTQEHLAGVTTLDGTEVKFDQRGVIDADTVRAQVHSQPFRIPVDSVQRWWLKRSDAGKTVMAVLGVAAGVILIAGAIAAATKESCPFVYSWDGSRYVFEAEPYGGAITRGLERDDYGVLTALRADSGLYRLLVTNEVNETQMTNMLELWLVDHAPGLRIVADERGTLHTIADLQAPRRAVDQTGRDLTAWLDREDQRIWEPLPVSDSLGGLRDEIVLTFPKPAGATHAKLVTRVGTALWGSHMIRSLLELRGTAVQSWYDSVDASAAKADSVRAWAAREELYGLQVQVEEPDGWHVRGLVPGSGPFLIAERVVPLDVSRTAGDSLRIRIRPPRGFWALDELAMDYTPDQPVTIATLHPRTATEPDGTNVLPLIASFDTLYHAMPRTGDRAVVSFDAPAPPAAGVERTVVLHSRGYYHLHLTPAGEPDVEMVRRVLEVPGAGAEYSAGLYSVWPMAHRSAK
jgi:hypothetical protein